MCPTQQKRAHSAKSVMRQYNLLSQQKFYDSAKCLMTRQKMLSQQILLSQQISRTRPHCRAYALRLGLGIGLRLVVTWLLGHAPITAQVTTNQQQAWAVGVARTGRGLEATWQLTLTLSLTLTVTLTLGHVTSTLTLALTLTPALNLMWAWWVINNVTMCVLRLKTSDQQ